MKIEVEVSEKNEGTSYPWWVIIDPKNCKTYQTVNSIAACTSGLFFSRESGEHYLESRNYEFSDEARVYCKSGYHSHQYVNAFLIAKTKKPMKLEDVIKEARKDDQKRFIVKIGDVNWIGTLRYLINNLNIDILIGKEFEPYKTQESEAVC